MKLPFRKATHAESAFVVSVILLAALYFGATYWIVRQMGEPVSELMLKMLHPPVFIAYSLLPGPVFRQTIALFVLGDCLLWGLAAAWTIRWLRRTLSQSGGS